VRKRAWAEWHGSCVCAGVDPQRVVFALLAALGVLVLAARISGADNDGDDAEPIDQESAPVALRPPLPAPAAPGFSLARECDSDCFGVEAGYRWAAARDLERAEECAGHAEAFADGCAAYAKERAERASPKEREERARTAALVAEERRPAAYVSLGDAFFQTHETWRR